MAGYSSGLKAPDATAVRVNFWSGPKIPSNKQADGFWTVTTPALVPGLHYLVLMVDGAGRPTSKPVLLWWLKVRQCCRSSRKGSVYYQIRTVPHGQVREVWYNSRRSRVAGATPWCTYPPSYETGNQLYLVLYLQHGAAKMRLDGSARKG